MIGLHVYTLSDISIDATVAPRSVMTTVMSSTVITVQWDGLRPCRHANGLIVLYRVQYTEVASAVVQSNDVAGGWNVMNAETSLTGLTPFTSYSIQVAAVNEEGDVGHYSEPLIRRTSKFNTPCLLWLYSTLKFVILFSVCTAKCDSGYHNNHLPLPLLD